MNLPDLLGERALFVHAHPDDETLSTGALIAACSHSGIDTVVVTCTRGERGEAVTGVVPADISAQELTEFRERELERAVGVLGVTQHHWLGQAPARAGHLEDRRYTDSGMVWLEEGVAGPADHEDPTMLTSASVDEAAADLSALIRTVHPTSVISYDHAGTYGHPDHVHTHLIAARAARDEGVPFVEIASDPHDPAFERIELHAYLDVVLEALSKYRSQLTVFPDYIEHVGGQRQDFSTGVALRRGAAG
ncbi:PIG-L family deacetylase [Flaviflexus huanghaiensis]|uniref:PIG-L family deacetylase n=1 Tax=Flaviflexus huanghaiensis TaxID=1111473 RepID=UPI0015FDA099|nr:PIG-L family deacetylase [Flaviflexus huanghaiensis]